YDLFVGKTLLHGDVLMWLMKTLLTSRCINQRGAGQPFLMVFFVVIMVLLLWKAGIPQAIIMLIIPIMFSTLGGMVAAVGVSAFATPIVGVPVGIVVFLMLMGKFLSRR
ncbi:hypothetical protein, partial [Enterobacter hormaechei]|uniref:hypothetical protein n=1 Tax=Enterobacter hormaechei TaxID=158836 RepID=UPI002B21305C